MESFSLNHNVFKSFNSVYKDFYNRKLPIYKRQSSLLKSCVPDFLLETFECAKDDKFQLFTEDLKETLAYQCRFCPEENLSHIAMVAKEDGGILFFNTELSSSQSIIQNFKAHKNCIFDCQWMDRNHIITSSGDWSIKYHDVTSEKIVSNFSGHAASVRALAIRPNHPKVFASSSRDGSIMLWDLDNRVPVSNETSEDNISSSGPFNTLFNAHHPTKVVSTILSKPNTRKSVNFLAEMPKSVTSVVFANENILVSSGSSDGKIKLWDIRKISKKNLEPVKTISYSGKMENNPGYTDLIVSRTGRMLFAYCKDQFVYQYDIQKPNCNIPLFQYTGHVSNSYYLKMDLSPDENYIICGSSSFSPYIYRIGLVPQRPVVLNGHKGEVTVCRWSPSNQGVVMSASDDCTVMIHRMKPGSEYNVFYRGLINNETKPVGHHFAPLSLSSRVGEETVNQNNQYCKLIEKNDNVATYNRIYEATSSETPALPTMPATPIKMKNQSIKSFLSPFTNPKLFEKSQTTPILVLGEKTNILSQRKIIDRSKSVMVKTNKILNSPQISGQKRCLATQEEQGEKNSTNRQQPKRRKTVLSQRPITLFLNSENHI